MKISFMGVTSWEKEMVAAEKQRVMEEQAARRKQIAEGLVD